MNKQREVYIFTKDNTVEKMVTSNDKILVLETEKGDYFDARNINSYNQLGFRPNDTKVTPLEVKTMNASLRVSDNFQMDKDENSKHITKILSETMKHGKLVETLVNKALLETVYVKEISFAVHPDNPMFDIVAAYEKQVKGNVASTFSLVKSQALVEEQKETIKQLEERCVELNRDINNPTLLALLLMSWFWFSNLFKK